MSDLQPRLWDPRGESAFNWVLDTVKRSFDHKLAQRIGRKPLEEGAINTWARVITTVGATNPGDPHPILVEEAAIEAARERDPGAIQVEDPDEFGDEGGLVLKAEWATATDVAFAAAVAYLYPGLMTQDESAILRRRWEEAMGPPPGSGA